MLRSCWGALPRYRQSLRLITLPQRLCKASSRSWYPIPNFGHRSGSSTSQISSPWKPLFDKDRETVIRFIDQLQESEHLKPRLFATGLKGSHENGTSVSAVRPARGRSDFIPRIYSMLRDPNVSPLELWATVKIYLGRYKPERDSTVNPTEVAALRQVLQRLLDHWAIAGLESGIDLHRIRPITIFLFFVQHGCVQNADWASFLSIVAPLAYRSSLYRPSHAASDSLAQRMTAAVHLGTLIRAWTLFVNGKEYQGLGRSFKPDDLEWQAPQDDESTEPLSRNSDFIGYFLASTSTLSQVEDTQLRRQIDCMSVLSLVALYNNVNTYRLHEVGKTLNEVHSISATVGLGMTPPIQPNWHLTPEPDKIWIPDVGIFSASEASLMYAAARAAVESPLNMTLFRITLAQLNLSEDELDDILRTYRNFQLAAPLVVHRFSGLEIDPIARENGLRRRWPFHGLVEDAVVGGDVNALETCTTVAEDLRRVGRLHPLDTLQLGSAFLRMDAVSQAIPWFELWLSAGTRGPQSWTPWLDYGFRKKDIDIVERVWRNLSKHNWRPTTNARNQRLRLFLERGEYNSGWQFLVATMRHSPNSNDPTCRQPSNFASPIIDQDIFHKFIEHYLEKEPYSLYTGTSSRAQQIISFWSRQEEHPTRDTYMLFIRQYLKWEDRPAAISKFVEGRNNGVTFTAGDFALVFEHDLLSQESLLSRPFDDVLTSTRAIANAMAFILDRSLPEPEGQKIKSEAGDTIVTRLAKLDSIDAITDDLPDLDIKEIQDMHADLIQHLAGHFPRQPEKLARLKLLLLLWDHCVAIGVPPSTKMKSILKSTISTLPKKLKVALIMGNPFLKHHKSLRAPPIYFRFIRLIGSEICFADLLGLSPGPIRYNLCSIPWTDGTNITDELLANSGISDPQQRADILTRLGTWIRVAPELRARLKFEAKMKPSIDRKPGRSEMHLRVEEARKDASLIKWMGN